MCGFCCVFTLWENCGDLLCCGVIYDKSCCSHTMGGCGVYAMMTFGFFNRFGRFLGFFGG